MPTIVFDIETGSLPWEQLATVYEPPPALPPWSEDMVKYGNMKDAGKRQDKRNAAYNEYLAKLANEQNAADLHQAEFISRAALSPLTGRVLAIGVRRGEKAILDGDEDEAEILRRWWGLYCKYRVNQGSLIVGFNSHGFDLPFLMRRSWYHGIQIPESVLEKGRYWNPILVDLMQVWNAGGREYVKLDVLARFFGIGGKPTGDGACTGAVFASLWNSGNEESRAAARAYLENDLEMTWKLAERLGVPV